MDAVSKEALLTSNQIANVFTYEFPEVDSELSIFTVQGDDVMGMEHFLEPDCNKGFTESVLDFHTLHSQKCFNIENFSFVVELDQIKIDGDLLHSDLFSGEETKEEDKIDLKSILKTADSGVTSNQNEGKTMFSPRSSQKSGCIPLAVSFPSDDGHCSVVQPTKTRRLSYDSYFKASNSEVEGQMSSLSMDEEYKAGSLIREKRLRKPPRRYIEEPLKNKLRASEGKLEISNTSTRSRSPCIRSNNHHCPKKPRVASPFFQKDAFNGGCIQVPFGLPMEETRPVFTKLTLEQQNCRVKRYLSLKGKNDTEAYSTESEDEYSEEKYVSYRNYRKSSRRRKHHVSWTLCEVMKLIEGVSQYGVGRWTEIKRLKFSSSPHRTSVDLKDKWRNLLRASETQLQSRKKGELGRKHASHQVPESVLSRVRELSIIYPYPRESKAKELCMVPAGFSFRSTSSGIFV